jgi:hypothetical protein
LTYKYTDGIIKTTIQKENEMYTTENRTLQDSKKKSNEVADISYEIPSEQFYKDLEVRNAASKLTEVSRKVKRLGNI